MNKVHFGYSTLVGMVIVLFIVLVGALSYTYALNYRAEVAKTPSTNNTIAAETMKVPAISQSKDLDTALQSLDTASSDTLSQNDLTSLQNELNHL